MIAGLRKAIGRTGSTPQPKKMNIGEDGEPNDTEDIVSGMSTEEMIKETLKTIREMKKDVSQATFEAKMANAAADNNA